MEKGRVELSNSKCFPFNDSAVTVAFENEQPSADYIVYTQAVSGDGEYGEIVVSDKTRNGFRIAFTGSARKVTVDFVIQGGDAV